LSSSSHIVRVGVVVVQQRRSECSKGEVILKLAVPKLEWSTQRIDDGRRPGAAVLTSVMPHGPSSLRYLRATILKSMSINHESFVMWSVYRSFNDDSLAMLCTTISSIPIEF